MEIIISNTITGVLIILAYTLGLKKGVIDINTSKIINVVKNPIKTIKNNIQESKYEEEIREKARLETIAINNIENYNGNGLGQVDIK